MHDEHTGTDSEIRASYGVDDYMSGPSDERTRTSPNIVDDSHP